MAAVERFVGRVEVERDADRCIAMRIKEQLEEQSSDGARIVVELVMPIVPDLASMLQPVERRLARKRLLGPVEGCHQRGIEAQRVVVDQILVPERLGEDALAQKIGEAVLDATGITVIREAARQPSAEPDDLVRCGPQHHAAIRADRTAIECVHKLALPQVSEVHLGLATLCRHRGSPSDLLKSLSQSHFR